MIPLLLALAAASPIISADERRPLALIVTAPAGNAAIRSSELIHAVEIVLERHTDLAAKPAPPELVQECRGQISCLLPRAREQVHDANLLLILSALPGASGDSLAAMLIDLAVEARRGAEAEADLQARALVAPMSRAAVASAADAEQFLEKLVTTDYRAALEQRGNYEPYGELVVVLDGPASLLRVDGETRGTLSPGETQVRLREGTRAIEVGPWSKNIPIVAGKSQRVPIAAAPPPSAPVRTAVFWAGLGLAAAGTAVAIYAATKPNDQVGELCLFGGARPAACGSGSSFATSRYDPEAGLAGRSAVNPPGLLIAPLGLAVASSGLVWSLSMFVEGDAREAIPWLEIGAGLATGALVYGISAVANGTPAGR